MQTLTIEATARGSILFTPVRGSEHWGRWECWRNCAEGALENGSVGLVPTGDWIAWDSDTGRIIGFPSRESAEQLCALQNGDKPTRVVDPFVGESESESEWTAEKVRALLPADLR